MRARAVAGTLTVAAATVFAATLHAQTPEIELRDALTESWQQAGLDAAVTEVHGAGETPVWLAYQTAAVARTGSLCCGHGDCCRVDGEPDAMALEPPLETGPIAVLVRFTDGRPDRIRVADGDCPVDFAGRRVLWVGDVPTGDSLELLTSWVHSASGRTAGNALRAIAYHDAPEATATLVSLALASGSDRLGEDAIFWLGAVRRHEGLEALRRLLDQPLAKDRRRAVVFGLSQSPLAAARDDLERLARSDPNSETRKEALFWLAQREGAAVGELIFRSALSDTDPAVGRHAVFVLSQLPEPGNVEWLARLLEQRQRPELRREALFWISQSNADGALEIVARVLND